MPAEDDLPTEDALEPYAYIRELAAKDRLSHAWLLLGEAAEAREALARFTAQALLCSGPGEKPCGVCPNCRKVLKGIHPDLIRVERDPDRRDITVNQARDLRQEAWVAPNEAGRKVFLIPEADSMNLNAQNALLKVLEEPPATAAFLLLGKTAGAFLPTVRSRCQTLRAAQEADEAAAKLAEAFIRGDRLAWAAAAFPCEKLDRAKFDALAEAVHTAAALRARAGGGETRRRALALAGLTEQVQEMRRVNVSPGHCLGWLGSHMEDRKEH